MRWLAAAVASLTLTQLYILYDAEDTRRRFMIECQDDMMRHYQCVSLWNGAGLAVFRGRDTLPLDVN
jgi:hypothetical protein